MGWQLRAVFPPEQIDGDPNTTFSRIAVGSEQVAGDSLFLLIEQEYMNTWRHLPEVVARGASCVVGPGARPELLRAHPEIAWVSVADPLAALQRLAVLMRDASPARRIAVTGSNGKTTTKDMIAHLLRLRYPKTLKSLGNYNGELGVPLTLRRLLPDDQFLVAEVGMGDPGSVKRRADLVRPHVAVITNIGESHLLRFGSRRAIAAEKGELLRALVPGGLAVLNGDDDECRRLAEEVAGPVIFFGLGPNCDWRADRIVQGRTSLSFRLWHEQQEIATVSLPLFGRYQVYNALAAIAVAAFEGIDPTLAPARLQSFRLGEQRGRVTQFGQVMLIDDAYNSNPRSVQQAAESLAELPVGSRWLVLGDMQPLYEKQSAAQYDVLAESLSALDLQGICLLGDEIARLADLYHGNARLCLFRDETELVDHLLRELPASGEAAALFKGQDDRLFARLVEQVSEGLRSKIR